MENFDLDQFLRNNMHTPPATGTMEEDWQKLTARLEKFDQKRHRMALFRWLGLLLFLLLISNFSWWLAWRSNTKEMEGLRASWKMFSTHDETRKQDQIISGKTIHVYDTVYHTVTIIEREKRGKIPEFSLYRRSGNFMEHNDRTAGYGAAASLNTMDTSDRVHSRLPLPEDTISTLKGGMSKNEIITSSTNGLNTTVAFIPPPGLPSAVAGKAPRMPSKVLQIVPQTIKKAPISYIIRHPSFGIYGGAVQPRSGYIPVSGGVIGGFMSEFPVSNKLSLTLNSGYAGISMKGYVYAEELGLPPLNPPAGDYKFKYFETDDGRKPVLDLGLGLRFYPWSWKAWRLFGGVNYLAQWQLPYSLEIEYFNPDNGMEISESVDVPFISKPVSMLGLSGGIRYAILSHVNIQFSGFYNIKTNRERFAIPYYRGITTGLFYTL